MVEPARGFELAMAIVVHERLAKVTFSSAVGSGRIVGACGLGSGSRSRASTLPFSFAFVFAFSFSLAFSLLSAFLSSFASAFAFAFVPVGGSARGTRLVGRIPRSPRMWGLVGIIATALRCPLWSPPTWLLGIAFLSLSLLPLNQCWADESVLETAFVAISFGAIAVFPIFEAVTSRGIADFRCGWLFGSGTRLASSF